MGGLTVNNGGTLAPGNSIGTMTVNGAFTLAPGAVYEVEVNATRAKRQGHRQRHGEPDQLSAACARRQRQLQAEDQLYDHRQ